MKRKGFTLIELLATIVILSIISTLLMIAISQIIIKNKDNKSNIIAEDSKKIPIGTYLCISNIVFLILQNWK